MRRVFALGLVIALIAAGGIGYYAGTHHLFAPAETTAAGAACITFPETGKQVCDRFLEYWQQSGGLAQQGLPLSNEFQEVSAVDGKTYTVQYFERAVFEKHPENAPPYDVLLTLLGREKFLAKYPNGPSVSPAPSPSPSQAPPTGWPRTASSGAVQMTVHEVRDPGPTTNFDQPAIGNRYVAIDVTLRNIGTEEFSTNKLYFRLRTGDGRDYQIEYVSVPEPQVSLRDLAPGQDTRGWITFELPSGLSVTNLTFDHILVDAPVTIPLN